MQVENRILDDIARVAMGALGLAAGARREAEDVLKQRLQRLLDDMDMVPREEFDAVRAMAAKARADHELLAKRVAALEAALPGSKSAPKKAGAKPASKRPAKKGAPGS